MRGVVRKAKGSRKNKGVSSQFIFIICFFTAIQVREGGQLSCELAGVDVEDP